MRYEIILIKSAEGYTVGCPALPGCWSEGDTREEAMANIRIAIIEYLECVTEDTALRTAEYQREGCEVEIDSVLLAA
jgi:predicted RNase H-like HicB family nuclease